MRPSKNSPFIGNNFIESSKWFLCQKIDKLKKKLSLISNFSSFSNILSVFRQPNSYRTKTGPQFNCDRTSHFFLHDERKKKKRKKTCQKQLNRIVKSRRLLKNIEVHYVKTLKQSAPTLCTIILNNYHVRRYYSTQNRWNTKFFPLNFKN